MIVEGKRKAEWFLGKKLTDPKYKGKKYFVLSETGERLFGAYTKKGDAKKRLGQMEYFKRIKNPGVLVNPEHLEGGLADGLKPSDFDPRALRKGIEVEMEHTNDRRIAREIAMDHLAEHPDYYEALEKMERELEENPTPSDPKLYKKVVQRAKKKFDVWPSIYASSWVVQEYKRQGGTYENPSGLQKWFDEEWVDLGRSIDKNGRVKKWVQCGRPDADQGAYPKCVPLAKAKKMTPKQRLSAVRRKRSAEKSAKNKKGRAPVMVSTFTKTSNPRKVLYIKPNKASIKAAKRGLEAREKAPKSKKGGLDAMQAKAEGVGSGVLRARDIIAGKRINAYQVKAFFDRHRTNYLNAKHKRLKPEESRAIQAWLIWGGDPLYKQVTAAVEKDRKKRKKNPYPVIPNPKGFWDRDHDWSQVLINKGGKRRTRKQILDYYLKNEKKIWPYLKGQTVLVIFGRGRNDFVLRRKGPDGKYIKLTKLKGIEDPNSFEYWIYRRAIEFHPVITGKTSSLVWIDVDPYKKSRAKGMEKLQKEIRKNVPLMKRLLKDEFGAKSIYVWRSGKADGGWHVEADLPRAMNVDKLRMKLRAALDEYFADNPMFTTSIARPGQIRLDTTLTKTNGSLRAPYSYTVDGEKKLPVAVKGFAKPIKKRRKARRNPPVTEADYEEAKRAAEGRRRPDLEHFAVGGNRLVYEIQLPGRPPFIFKADQGFKGTRLQTQDEVENIWNGGSPLFPQIYDYDRTGYRWVEMEKLVPFEANADSRSRFKRFTGIDWEDFDTAVEGIPLNASDEHIELAREMLVKNKKSEKFFNELLNLWELGLSPYEMTVIENWGTTPDGKILKYLDAGA